MKRPWDAEIHKDAAADIIGGMIVIWLAFAIMWLGLALGMTS